MKELFNNGKIKVFTNGSGEIFVENVKKENGATIRISPSLSKDLKLTASGCNFKPGNFGGLGGFYIVREEN